MSESESRESPEASRLHTKLISKLWEWKKWIVILLPSATFFYLIINFILFNTIPTCPGEFRFRDIQKASDNPKWQIFNHSQGDLWKSHIFSYPLANSQHVKLGEYEIITATRFIHSLGTKKLPPMGPIDTRFISFLLQKDGQADLHLTLEKVSVLPELAEYVVGNNDGGVFAQLSDSRDESLRAMKERYNRPNLDIGTLRWRKKDGSIITIERFLRYYTQKSAHLSPAYNFYSSNCQHHASSTISLLKQLQDFDLRGEAQKDTDENKGQMPGFLQFTASRLIDLLGHNVVAP